MCSRSCALDAQVSPAFSTSGLGFEPFSPVAFLCIQMAGTTKRLRRKTKVVQKGRNELMLFTSEWWMQFLLPVGRYMSMLAWYSDYRHGWTWVWRLLSTEWREVWDQGFRIKLLVHEARVSDLCHAARWYDDLKFSRDSCNKLVYHRTTSMLDGRFCLATMPWKTFAGLRPFLSQFGLCERPCRMWPSFHF